MLVVKHEKFFVGEDGHLTVEASDLELKPGEWPDYIGVINDGERSGIIFLKFKYIANNGEFGGFVYVNIHDGKTTLTVFND